MAFCPGLGQYSPLRLAHLVRPLKPELLQQSDEPGLRPTILEPLNSRASPLFVLPGQQGQLDQYESAV